MTTPSDQDLAGRLKAFFAGKTNLTRAGGKNYANSEEIPLGDGTVKREQVIKDRKVSGKPKVFGNIKYAYSVVEGQNIVVYVGGHVKQPVEVFRVPKTSTVSVQGLNNMGTKGYALGVIVTVSGVRKIQYWTTGQKQWEFEWKSYDQGGAGQYDYVGYGFWRGTRGVADQTVTTITGIDTYTVTDLYTLQFSSLFNGIETSTVLSTTGSVYNYGSTGGFSGYGTLNFTITKLGQAYILPTTVKQGVNHEYGAGGGWRIDDASGGNGSRNGSAFTYFTVGVNSSMTVVIGEYRSYNGAGSYYPIVDNSTSRYAPFWFSKTEEIIGTPYLTYGPPKTEFSAGGYGYEVYDPASSIGGSAIGNPYVNEDDPNFRLFWDFDDSMNNSPGSPYYATAKNVDVFDATFALSWSEKYGTGWSTKAFDQGKGEITVERYDKNFKKYKTSKEIVYPPKTRVSIGTFSYHFPE
jgi:hypothetical protein